MKNIILICVLLLTTNAVFGQDSPRTAVGKLGPNPMYIVDSQKVTKSDLANYNADSIAAVIILYDTSAIKLYGDSAKDGVVIIETSAFARKQFISFFRKSSRAYDSLYSTLGNDTSFVYIINNKVQKGNFEGNLSSITDELFVGLDILTRKLLYTKYKISNKQFGILIHAKRPKDLYNGKKKF